MFNDTPFLHEMVFVKEVQSRACRVRSQRAIEAWKCITKYDGEYTVEVRQGNGWKSPGELALV